MTYMKEIKPIQHQTTDGWIWEEPGLVIPNYEFNWTVTPVNYYGRNMSLSQVIPISIYNQTAYSIVTETNFAEYYAFHTEKIVKPMLAKRLFIVYGGCHYLKSLHHLGFKTFDSIIDESYDNESNYEKRGQLIIEQMEYLFTQPQEQILEQIKPIVEHNYNHMISTQWYQNFSDDFALLICP